MLTPQMEPEIAPSLEAPTLAAPSATQERPPQSSYLRLAASSNPTVAVRINTPSDSRTLSVDETVNCEIRLTGAGSEASGPISVTLWCPDDDGGQGPPDRFVFLDDEGNPSKGNQLHPALQLNTPFRFRIKGRYAGSSKMNVRLGKAYDSSRRDFSSTALTVRGTAPNVDRIQFRLGTRWYDWGDEARSMLRGRRVRLRAVPSAGSWPSGYPRWTASPNDSDDVSIRVDGDKTCVVEYKQISTSIQRTGYKKVTARGADTKEAKAIVGELGLFSVEFRGNTHIRRDSGAYYGNPEWTAAAQHPISFAGGHKFQAGAVLFARPTGFSGTFSVRGVGAGGGVSFPLPEEQVEIGGNSTYPFSQSSKTFARSVITYDPFIITWQAKVNGTWSTFGESRNKLYRTLGSPQTPNFYETVVRIGCANATGATSSSAVANAIWNEFANRVVKRANDTPATGMRYWGPDATSSAPGLTEGQLRDSLRRSGVTWTEQQIALRMSIENGETERYNQNFTTPGLIATADGRCGSWQDLMKDVLLAQGNSVATGFFTIDIYPPNPPASSNITSVRTSSGFPLFTYNGGGSTYQFINKLAVKESHNAQGGAPGQYKFVNHAVLQKGSAVYDSSYGSGRSDGRPYSSRYDWQTHSLSVFFWDDITNGVAVNRRLATASGTNAQWVNQRNLVP